MSPYWGLLPGVKAVLGFTQERIPDTSQTRGESGKAGFIEQGGPARETAPWTEWQTLLTWKGRETQPPLEAELMFVCSFYRKLLVWGNRVGRGWDEIQPFQGVLCGLVFSLDGMGKQ